MPGICGDSSDDDDSDAGAAIDDEDPDDDGDLHACFCFSRSYEDGTTMEAGVMEDLSNGGVAMEATTAKMQNTTTTTTGTNG